MKKILFLLLGILCPLGIMAQDLTFGITRTIASESTTASDGKTTGYAVSNEELVGDNASSFVTLAKAHSANNSIMTDKARTIYHGSDKCYVDKGIENVRSTTTTIGENYYAFTLTIKDGYSLSIKSIYGDVCVENNNFIYKIEIESAKGILKFSEVSLKESNGKTTIDTNSLYPDLQAKLNDMIGTVTVKMYWTNTAKTGKYCIIKDFNVTATVQESQVETVEITGSIEPENAGTISGIGKIVKGSDATLKATPNAGYKFSNWVIDDEDSKDNPYEIKNVTSAHTVKAIFAPIPMITFEKGEGIGTVPETDYAEGNYALPTPRFLTSKGKTFIGWNDGTTTHPSGTTIEIKENTTLTAMFADNEVALGQEETVVDWTFARKEGAPLIKCEGNEIDYVATVMINDKPLDVVLHIDGKNGKVNNSSDEKFAQVNKGTKFTIPAIKGMEITYPTNNKTPKPEDFSFNGEPATSIDGKVVKFTYNGNAETLEIVENTGNFYPSGIKVTYPKVRKKDNSDDFINVDNGGYDPENGLNPSDDFPTGSIESPTRPENGLITFPSDDTENADQNGTVTGIDNASAAASVVAIYTANGKRVNTLQKGLNIVTLSDGSRIKVIK